MRFKMCLVLIAALFVHLGLLNYITVLGARPDLFLICVVFIGLFFGPNKGLECGIIAGLLIDIFSSSPFGINMLVLGLMGFISGSLNAKIFKEQRLSQIFSVFFFSLASLALSFIVSCIVSGSREIETIARYIRHYMLFSSVYTALVSIFIFPRFILFFRVTRDEKYL